MLISKMADMVSEKAALYGDQDLVFIAHELALRAQLTALPTLKGYAGAAFLSIPNAAAVLSLSTDYVWKLVASGQLPSVKIGKRRLIRYSVLLAYADSHTTTSEGRPS